VQKEQKEIVLINGVSQKKKDIICKICT